MPLFIQYLIKFSISLGLVYIFYQLVLRRLTFYNCNRWYLLGYLCLSLVLPFININPIVEKTVIASAPVIHIPAFISQTTNATNVFLSNSFFSSISWWNVVLFILMTGSLILMIRLCIQFLSLQSMKQKAVKISESTVDVFHVEKSIIPFSFGNNIYINRHLHTEQEMEDIILHEYVHVRQKHTIDILAAELLCIFAWYNPFAWLMRKAIKQNLEFIADHQVLQTGIDKKNYQYHLLKVTGMPQYGIASNFNFSSLKKRIIMMNKIKTTKVQLLRFLFLLPLLAVVLLAFRNREAGITPEKKTILAAVESLRDSIPLQQKDSMENKVSSINQNGPNVVVKLRNGKTETYDLQHETERKVYENKYGVYLEKMRIKQLALEETMRKMQNDERLNSNESFEKLQKMQAELGLALEKNERQQQIEKELLEIQSKKAEEHLLQSKEYLENLFNQENDSTYKRLLDDQTPNKLLLEAELNYLKNNPGPAKLNDKEALKRMQKEVQMEQIQLQKNLKQLELRQRDIEKQLKKLPNDKVSYNYFNEKNVPIQAVRFVDNVSAENNMMHWELEKANLAQPLFLVDGKPVAKNETIINVKTEDRAMMEFVPKGEILKKYGDAARGGLVNIVTKANINNSAAHILRVADSYSSEELAKQNLTSVLVNTLYIGKDNPLNIVVPNLNEKEIEVKMDKGTIVKRNGLYYANPSSLGNVEIKIYRKTTGGNLQLLNSRFFRVEEQYLRTHSSNS